MIQKIELTNFKGFRKLELKDLARITLFGGPNSVGKTSILEAVFMFFDRGNPELIVRQFPWRGMGKVYLSTEQMFSPVFNDYALDKVVAIALTIDGREEKLAVSFRDRLAKKSVNKRKIFERKSSATAEDRPVVQGKLDLRYTKGSSTEETSLILTAKELTLRDPNGSAPEKRPAIFLNSRITASPPEDAQRFSKLDIAGDAEPVVEFLQDFDKRVKGLSVIFFADSAVIHADIGLSRKIPVPQLGEGLAVMLSTFLAIGAAKGGTLLIDEIGTGIHHDYLPKFWEGIATAARKYDCQILGTTHSYECMQAAAIGLKGLTEPEFAYIRLDRVKDQTDTSVYSFPVLEAALESGWEVR